MNASDKRREQHKKEKKLYQEKRKREAKEIILQAIRADLVFLPHEDCTPKPCGECQCCCEAIAIGEDGIDPRIEYKPNYVKCSKQCESGCSIYEDRPQECKDYYCLYQIGALSGKEEMRPDRLGVLMDFRPDAKGRPTIVLWETRPNALNEPFVQSLIVRIMKIHPNVKLAKNDYRFNYPLKVL